MIEFGFEMNIKSKELFHTFIKRKTYETFLLDLINNNDYFKDKKFKIIEPQPNGEYDFICVDDNEIKYEATLLLNDKITKELTKDLSAFGSSEFGNFVYYELENTLITRLEKKKKKQNIIVFNIYPFREIYFKRSILLKFAEDKWDFMIENIEINKKYLIEGKKIILVTFTTNNEFLIRELYPNNSAFNKYVTSKFNKDIFPFEIIKSNYRII